MYLKNNHFLTSFFSCILTGRKKSVTEHAPKYCTKIFLFGITLLVSMTLTGNTWATEHQGAEKYENLDSRWLPWVGSWRLVSNKINTSERPSKGEYFLTMSPGSNENAITMKGNQDEKVLIEEEIIADGLRHPLKDEKCSGYYEYSWSESGKRLLLNSEVNCPGDPPRQISGMSIINDNRDWVDIQLLQNGAEKAISIRKYRNIDSDSTPLGRFNPDQVRVSRIAAGKNFTISEIKELSSKVEPEILEAALLEVRKPFPINSKQLVSLSDSGVNSRVVDLMVAFSFPDKFNVEQETISLAQVEGSRMIYHHFRHPYNYYSYYYPILPWHWTSSSYMSYVYGYSYLGWYLDGYYYYPLWTYHPSHLYYYDYYDRGGGGTGRTVENKGTAVKGRGYTRVAPDSSGSSPRYARPRNTPAPQSAPVQSSSSSSSGGSSPKYSSGSGSKSSGSSNPTASPRGYSRGGR